MAPPPPVHPRPAATAPPSLWRDLADGSAGWGVRLLVTLALAAALGGLVPIVAYFLAATNPGWNRAPSYGIYPIDELVIFLVIAAAAAFLVGVIWLWSRSARRRAVLAPAVRTIGVVMATTVLGVAAEDRLPGDGEFIVLGLVCLGASAVILVWVQAYRRRGPGWRSLHNPQDGMPDILCPTCGYRMVGLTETRCPECGTIYTLDELLAKQGFGPVRTGPGMSTTGEPAPPTAAVPPPPPPIMRSA